MYGNTILKFVMVVCSLLCGIHLHAQPIANFTADSLSGCSPQIVHFTSTSTGGPTSYYWDFGNGSHSVLANPSTTYTAGGTYTVSLTVSNTSGSNTKTLTNYITIYGNPIVDFLANDTVSCPPITVTFTDASNPQVPGAASYNWSFGDGTPFSTVQNAVHVYPNAGYYNVTLTVTGNTGCVSSLTKTNYIHVRTPPVVNFQTIPTSYCDYPATASFTSTVTGNAPYSYYWTFGDGGTSSGSNPTHVYNNPGTYNVRLIVTDGQGCKDTILKSNYVSVGSLIPAFSASSACQNAPVQFTNTSTNATTVLWRFGDGGTDTAQNPSHIYTSAGTYNVTLLVYNNPCVDSVTIPVLVHPQPHADFTFLPKHPCPAPSSIQFNNTSTGASSYLWDFGDTGTSALTSPSHMYNWNDSFLVRLIATSSFGCMDTTYQTDTVQKIIFSFGTVGNVGCAPVWLPFSCSILSNTPDSPFSHVYTDPIVSYAWDLGDGTTSTADTFHHLYSTPGIYPVSLTVTTANGCVVTDTQALNVGFQPHASFIGYPDTLCVGVPANFINTSTGTNGYTVYTWVSESADNTFNFIHEFITSGIYDVKLIVDNFGCIDTMRIDSAVVVLPPTSHFTIRYSCDTPLMVRIEADSVDITSMYWTLGDGTSDTMASITHFYPSAGNYSPILYTFNDSTGCADTAHTLLQLYQPTLSIFTPDTAICKGDSIVFTPSAAGFPNPLTYVWAINNDWNNSDTSYGQWGYRFMENGIDTVSLTTTYDHNNFQVCMDTVTRYNYILVAKPTAAFTGTPLLGCAPLDVTFTETSTNTPGAFSVSRAWDFGNGTSTVSTASTNHIYNTPGVYNVGLIVTDNVGCSDTLLIPNYVDARHPVAGFSAVNTSACAGDLIQFSNSSVGNNVTSSWDFGDGTTSTVSSPIKSYSQQGAFTVTLIITDSIGCTDTLIKTAYINISKPTAAFTLSDTLAICPPLNLILTNISSGASSYAWDFGNGSTSTIQNPTSTYTIPGVYNIRLIAKNISGCKDTAYHSVTVLGYAGGLTYTPIAGCNPLTVQFTANLTNVPSIIWDFSDGVTMPLTGSNTVTHTYTNPGAYMPKLILSDNSSCQNSSLGIDTIKVDAVLAGFITSPPCINTPVAFSDTSFSYFSPVTQWSWDFNNGQQTSNVHNPTMNYSTAGTYPVTLVAVNAQGCRDSISRTVTIYDLPVIGAGSDTTVCKGDPALLIATGGVSYTWIPIAALSCNSCQTTNASPSVTTDYIVTGTDQNGCQNKDTVKVQVQDVTSSEVDEGGSICIDSVFQLHAFGAQKYEWNPAATLNAYNIADPLASPKETTIYTVLAWEGSCPPDSHAVRVVVLPKPIVDAGSNVSIVAGSSVMLQAIGTNISDFIWSPVATLSCETCSNPTANPAVTTTYKVIAATQYGCKSYDTVTVNVLCDESQLFIPNTFTPNNDGENDIFYPRGAGLKSISSFRIYNRWGEVVFERKGIQLNDASTGWDGTYKGQPLNPDVYVYIIDGVCERGETISWKGDVSIVR